MTKRLILLTTLLVSAAGAQTYNWLVSSKYVGAGGVAEDYQGGAVAMSGDGTTAAWASMSTSVGRVWIYTTINGTTWSSQTMLSGSYGFGATLSFSNDGNTLIIGTPTADSVAVYFRSGTSWALQQALTRTGQVGTSHCLGRGLTLSSDGNTAAAGDTCDGGDSTGAVWVWTRSGTTWTQQQKLVGSNAYIAASHASYGQGVGLSGDSNTLIVGAPGYNPQGYISNGYGALFAWTRSAGVWTEQGSAMVPPDNTASSLMGSFVSVSSNGNTVLANNGETYHSARVWTRTGSNWSMQADLAGTGGGYGNDSQGSGMSLSSSGNVAVETSGNEPGAVSYMWTWTRTGTVWTQNAPPVTVIGSSSIYSMAGSADGTRVIVGQIWDTSNKGAVYFLKATISSPSTRRIILVN